MSVLAYLIVNFVLAAALVVAMVQFHLWAILTAHRDHVPAAEPAPVILLEDQRQEVLVEDVALVGVSA